MTVPRERRKLPIYGGFVPGRGYRWARRACQSLALIAIVLAPLLGGFQRLDRNYLSAWQAEGWDLPGWLIDVLPLGAAPSRAYEANQLMGGGTAVEYVSVPVVDPVAGLVALGSAAWDYRFWLAWLLPVGLALVAGRWFCGWFCPFGTLSRGLRALVQRLPFSPPRLAVPERRGLRWIVLGGSVVLGALGLPGLLYLTLPHAFLQQSVYGLWLMGGGGAALGWLLGLLLAGLVFGPTVYCATLCPTGAALSLGRRVGPNLMQVTLQEPSRCGTHCELCSRACWIDLDPASGDPGADCDACTRCFEVCPRNNLQVGWVRRPGGGAARAALALFVLGCAALPAQAQMPTERVKPRLLLESHRTVQDVTVSLAVVDKTEQRLDADAMAEVGTVQLSAVLVRGPREQADGRGVLERREHYDGPLTFEVRDGEGRQRVLVRLEAPNEPLSTVRTSIYRTQLRSDVQPGDHIRVTVEEAWLAEPLHYHIPDPHPSRGWARTLWAGLAALLLFGGLLSFALVDWGTLWGRLARGSPRAASRDPASVNPPPHVATRGDTGSH